MMTTRLRLLRGCRSCERRGGRSIEASPQSQMQVDAVRKLSISQLDEISLALNEPFLQLQQGQKIHRAGPVLQLSHTYSFAVIADRTLCVDEAIGHELFIGQGNFNFFKGPQGHTAKMSDGPLLLRG